MELKTVNQVKGKRMKKECKGNDSSPPTSTTYAQPAFKPRCFGKTSSCQSSTVEHVKGTEYLLVQQQLKQECATNTALITTLKYSIVKSSCEVHEVEVGDNFY